MTWLAVPKPLDLFNLFKDPKTGHEDFALATRPSGGQPGLSTH